jgi:hypothetical protein
MRLRLVAFAVVMLFVASPLATTVCDAMCAQRADAHHGGHGHACCHDDQTAGAALQGLAASVVCGTPMADSVSAVWRFRDAGRSVLLPSKAADRSESIGVASRPVDATSRPPTVFPSASQLRI